jgi:hypothetical protein
MINSNSPTNHAFINKARRETINHLSTLLYGIVIGFVTSSLLYFQVGSTTLDVMGRYHNGTHVGYGPIITAGHYKPECQHSPRTTTKDNDDDDSSGWKDIHVFYGNSAHLKDTTSLPIQYFQSHTWFSQFKQDEIVSQLLGGKRGGYFIDLAANDPVRISNTYALETHFNWNGLCLEPNPIYWSGLSYRKCHVVGAVIGPNHMEEIVFRFPKEKAPKGGIVGEQFDNKATDGGNNKNINNNNDNIRPRYTVTVLEILERFHVPTTIDYLSLDIEGAEEWVMSSFPFSKYQINVLTVERPSVSMSQLLTNNGYIFLKTLKMPTETLWIHQSMVGKIDLTALEIDSENYKYRENTANQREIDSRR